MNLILFLKTPGRGKVKTRLAAGLGEKKALEIYLDLLHHTLQVSLQLPLRRLIFFEGEEPRDNPSWLPPGEFLFFRQEGKDLGERMKTAFRQTANRYPREATLLVGSDVPDLSAVVLSAAFRQISPGPNGTPPPNDLVIGPAEDGGYYLIGLSPDCLQDEDCLEALFDDMQWSHDKVFLQTLQRLSPLSVKLALTPMLKDIDRPEDLQNGFRPIRP